MLLDKRLLESGGDTIAARAGERRARARVVAVALALLAGIALLPGAAAQSANEADRRLATFRQAWPDVYARLIGQERAQGIFFGAVAAGRVNEPDVLGRMTRRLSTEASAAPDAEADKGYEALGQRGAEIVRRTNAFHREVLAIVAGVAAGERRAALDAAADRYLSRRDVALPDVPKDMTVLYDQPYSSFMPPEPGELEPHRKLVYPSLTGFVWASHWYQLAATEPLDRFADQGERASGLTQVAEKFQRKLSSGKPPDAYPTELPLAPSIAPDLVSTHERSAAIIDNLNMMLDIIADVMVHPSVPDRRKAVDEVIAQFTQRSYRCVIADEWITMALRHSIFEQGGPALGTMRANERNGSGHAQHVGGRRSVTPCEAE